MTNKYTNPWKDKDIQLLKENWGKKLGRDIAKRLGRTYCAVRHKAERLGLDAPPLSDFKNNNPAKIPFIKEKIRKYQTERWQDKTSVLNTEEYREKQRKSLKKAWKRPKFLKKMKFRDSHCRNKGKKRTEEMKEHYRKSHKLLWEDPDSTYNTPKFRKELEKRPKDMLRAQHRRPNKPEKKVIEILKKSRLPFEYTGDGRLWIHGFNPDFIFSNLIIEVNGIHWHNIPKYKERDKRKLKVYASHGYKVLTIWENELKDDPEIVTKKIKGFLNRNT